MVRRWLWLFWFRIIDLIENRWGPFWYRSHNAADAVVGSLCAAWLAALVLLAVEFPPLPAVDAAVLASWVQAVGSIAAVGLAAAIAVLAPRWSEAAKQRRARRHVAELLMGLCNIGWAEALGGAEPIGPVARRICGQIDWVLERLGHFDTATIGGDAAWQMMRLHSGLIECREKIDRVEERLDLDVCGLELGELACGAAIGFGKGTGWRAPTDDWLWGDVVVGLKHAALIEERRWQRQSVEETGEAMRDLFNQRYEMSRDMKLYVESINRPKAW